MGQGGLVAPRPAPPCPLPRLRRELTFLLSRVTRTRTRNPLLEYIEITAYSTRSGTRSQSAVQRFGSDPVQNEAFEVTNVTKGILQQPLVTSEPVNLLHTLLRYRCKEMLS